MTLDDFRVYDNGRELRAGYTTGTCAAAAAKASLTMLLTGEAVEAVFVTLPAGPVLTLETEEVRMERDFCSCAVRKDAGDDPDVTDGILVHVKAELVPGPAGVEILGGAGIGRVTRPGLDQPPGEAAINRVPREMIRQGAEEVLKAAGVSPRVRFTVSAPEGEALAGKTFNPRLGITGGISILGTSGVVKPMSRSALVDTIRVDMRVHAAEGRPVLAVPGNYGLAFLSRTYGIPEADPVIISNYVGEAVDAACEYGARGLVLAGHLGKFVKLAGGIMNTHSREADCRMEILLAHAVRCGAPQEVLRRILGAAATEEAVDLIDGAGLKEAVFSSVLTAAEKSISRRSGGRISTAVIIYTLKHGILAESGNARQLIEAYKGGGGTWERS